MSEGLDPGRPAVPPTWPAIAACVVAAAWIGMGSIHRGHHADSFIPVLVSLQAWTPFYWEQDRFGMLVPLLAWPIRDPMGNLLAQGVLMIAGGLASFFLLARFAARDASYPLAATLAASTFVLLAPDRYRFDYLITQPYGLGLTLALLGLILAESKGERESGGVALKRFSLERDVTPGKKGDRPSASLRVSPFFPRSTRSKTALTGALALVLVAHWVNCATAIYLAPLVAARGAWDLLADLGPTISLARRVRARLGEGRIGELDIGQIVGACFRWAKGSETARALILLAAGYLAGAWLMGLATNAFSTNTEALPIAAWPATWRRLAEETAKALAPGAWPIVFGVAGAAGLGALVASPEARRRSPGATRGAIALLASALAIFLLIGTRVWVTFNDWHSRYVAVAVVQAQAACWLVAVAPLRARAGRPWSRWALVLAPAGLLILASVVRDGLPSPAGVRAGFDRRYGAMTTDLLGAGCTHMAGNYWTVWPAVFHANLVLHDRGEGRQLWGVTFRGFPTRAEANRTVPRDRVRLAISAEEQGTPANLSGRDIEPIVEVDGRPTIRVFRPAPKTIGPR